MDALAIGKFSASSSWPLRVLFHFDCYFYQMHSPLLSSPLLVGTIKKMEAFFIREALSVAGQQSTQYHLTILTIKNSPVPSCSSYDNEAKSSFVVGSVVRSSTWFSSRGRTQGPCLVCGSNQCKAKQNTNDDDDNNKGELWHSLVNTIGSILHVTSN